MHLSIFGTASFTPVRIMFDRDVESGSMIAMPDEKEIKDSVVVGREQEASLPRRQSQGRKTSPTAWETLLAVAALVLPIILVIGIDPEAADTGNPEMKNPVLSHPGGYYDHDLSLEITLPYPSAEVRFTMDGSAPSLNHGAVYTRPIQLSAAIPGVTVVRAAAMGPEGQSIGEVISASYVMGIDATLPIVSLIVDPDDLWRPKHGIYVDPLPRGIAWERPVHVTFVDNDRASSFQVNAGLRIHGYQSRAFAKKSFRLYFRSEYGVRRLDYPLFPDTDLQSFNRLVLHSGGQDWPYPPLTNWTLMRNQLAAQLAFEVDGYATHSRPAVLFLNGEPWGLYQIRERIDEDFLEDQYQITDADFLDSPESALRETLMGDRQHWDHLMAFVEAHDLSDPAAYAYVKSQVNLKNFIDYTIIQIYSANTDWPAHNVYLFRPRVPGGRWHWLFWDSDNGFGADSYSQIDTDMISHLLDYNHPETAGRDVMLFRKLLQNPVFRSDFLSRAATLLDTVLVPNAVIGHVDRLAADMAPDIEYETRRWPGPTDWHTNVQQLREFAAQRPAYVRQHLVARLGLNGTTALNIQPPFEGSGQISVEGTVLPMLPTQRHIFQDVPLRITAIPAQGYRFDGWEPPELGQSTVLTLTTETAQLSIAPRFVRDDAHQSRVGNVRLLNVHVDDTGDIEGDWFEIQVLRPDGLDLTGWRITDNDTPTSTDEGTLIFNDNPALTRVPWGTTIRVIATRTTANDKRFPQDDLNALDRRIVLYVGNDTLNTTTDPWFNLGFKDNLVLLPPHLDRGMAFWSSGPVAPVAFGMSDDGSRHPMRNLSLTTLETQ